VKLLIAILILAGSAFVASQTGIVGDPPECLDVNTSEKAKKCADHYKPKPMMTKIPCKPGSVDVDNQGTIGHATISNSHSDCILKLDAKQNDVTINGKHYDWCGPTHDGYTPCYRKVAAPVRKDIK
jgi:hypothetical protein